MRFLGRVLLLAPRDDQRRVRVGAQVSRFTFTNQKAEFDHCVFESRPEDALAVKRPLENIFYHESWIDRQS